jgi:pimeloyl-ACP methyl ester carboxylesterase
MPSRRPRVRGRLAVAIAVALSLSACGSSGGDVNAAPGDSKAVSFRASDGVQLAGRVFGTGPRGVILAHMKPADQRSWFDFANRLVSDGYHVLTFDFRGYCPGGVGGCSQGDPTIAGIWKDVVGAIDYMRDDQHVDTLSLIGASMGGTASLIAAAQPNAVVRAVITLSAPTEIEGLVADANVLAQVTAGKLFIAGVGDASAAQSAQTLYDESPPPKRVEILPADDHGTDLLTGAQGEVVSRLIETYLETNGS